MLKVLLIKPWRLSRSLVGTDTVIRRKKRNWVIKQRTQTKIWCFQIHQTQKEVLYYLRSSYSKAVIDLKLMFLKISRTFKVIEVRLFRGIKFQQSLKVIISLRWQPVGNKSLKKVMTNTCNFALESEKKTVRLRFIQLKIKNLETKMFQQTILLLRTYIKKTNPSKKSPNSFMNMRKDA